MEKRFATVEKSSVRRHLCHERRPGIAAAAAAVVVVMTGKTCLSRLNVGEMIERRSGDCSRTSSPLRRMMLKALEGEGGDVG